MRAFPLAVALLLLHASAADATLIDFGNGLIYDTEQDLTWLDPFHAQPPHEMIQRDSGNCLFAPCDWNYTWPGATAWAANLVYEGYDDWRLPDGRYGGDNELHLMMEQLPGWQFTTTMQGEPELLVRGDLGPFRGPLPYWFVWIDEIYTYTSPAAGGGYDFPDQLEALRGVQAVRSGAPISRVPEPSTLMLLGAGVLSTLTLRRRRSARN